MWPTIVPCSKLDIFKDDSLDKYANDLADYIKFCFDVCCPLKKLYITPLRILFHYLSNLRQKKRKAV